MAGEEVLTFDWDDLGEVERAEAILGVFDTLFQRVDRHIELVNRLDESHPVVVERAMQTCLGVVDMIYTGRENTCVDSAAYYQNSWEVDSEPEPAPLDVWARGAVVTKQLPQLPGKPRLGTSVASTPSLKKKRPGAEAQDLESSPSEKSRSRLSSSKATTPTIRRPGRPKPPPEELERDRRLREELELRRRQDEVTRQLVAEEKRAQEQLAEMRKNLKGKEYSYDHKGDVVVLARVDPDRLPAMALRPGTTLAEHDESGSQAPTSRGSSVGRSGGRPLEHRPAAQRAAGRAANQGRQRDAAPADGHSPAYIESPNEGQPPPGDSIKPEPGVTLTSGKTVRRGGPRRIEAVAQMSKKEFAEYIQRDGQFEALTPEQSKRQAEQEKRLAAQRVEYQRMQERAAMHGGGGGAHGSTAPRRSSEDEAGPLGLGVPSGRAPAWIADGIAGAAEEAKERPGQRQRSARAGAAPRPSPKGWRAARLPQGSEQQQSVSRDSSPGKPPARPSAEDRERTVGKVPRRPRDRRFGCVTERELQDGQQGSP
mmetsp:Transcript_42922/g.101925  ORF Transcript_42922/g.101925 Transcript_42922/m.101925 type:complete len:539 (+) Transcript_42922:332-1948(+)